MDRISRLLPILSLFLSAALPAQTSLSTVRGTITDPSGLVVPGVEVTLTDIATNVLARSAISDSNGNFEMPDLKPGIYRLRAELSGFKAHVADNLALEGTQIRRMDIRLDVGQVAEQITVEAGRAVIETDTAEISTGFTQKLFDSSPMVRTYYPQALMATLPTTDSTLGTYALRIAGQPSTQVAEGMDGVWTNDGTVNLINNMMDFNELTVVAVNNRADQARVANFNMVSKRGDNTFHGTAFYSHFNSALNAREFFQPRKPVLIEHKAHADVSGPIFPNRTFFYASYFHQKLPAGSFIRGTVPTQKMRQGDFTQVTGTVRDPLTNQPFPGNIVPASRFNATTQKAQQLYIPTPNLGDPDTLINNLGFEHPYPTDLFQADYPMVRIDHNISSKNTIYGRYIRRYTPYVLNRLLPGFDWTRVRWHRGTVISDTHVFSPTLVNTFRFGWMWDNVEDGTEVDGFTPRRGDQVVQEIGLQGVNPRNLQAMGFPRMEITGLSTLETNPGGVVQDDHSFIFSESLTWSKDRHVWKFGGDFKRVGRFASVVRAGTYGDFRFNGSLTGHPYADFLLGLPDRSIRLDPLLDRTQIGYEHGLYIMDTFKLNAKLTLDYGLRWDYFSAPYYEDGLQYNWDAATGNVVVPEAALSSVSPLYPANIKIVTGQVEPDSDLGNFRPRLGFAYRLGRDTVVRGGYGVFTEHIGYFDRLQSGGPFEIAETYFNAIENGVPRFAFPNPFPTSLASASIPSQSIRGFPLQTRHGSIHQFNLSVERQIRDLGVRVSYIGSRSRGLNYALNVNKPRPSLDRFTPDRRPYAQFVGATYVEEDGASNYDGFQLEVQKRAGAFTFDGHYTLQSNVSNFLNLENPYDHLHWNREQLARQKFVFNALISLPFGRGRRYLSDAPGYLDQIVGGWELVSLTFFKSGPFFSPAFSGADPSNTNTTGGLPDRLADGNIPAGDRRVERWFDPSAFRVPALGQFGNAGVNILEGPGNTLQHLSMVKRFRATERLTVEYVAGISNLFNTPHFRFPRNDISVARPGEIEANRTSDQDNEKAGPRLIEMTLRLRW
jgi:hypothetical protein